MKNLGKILLILSFLPIFSLGVFFVCQYGVENASTNDAYEDQEAVDQANGYTLDYLINFYDCFDDVIFEYTDENGNEKDISIYYDTMTGGEYTFIDKILPNSLVRVRLNYREGDFRLGTSGTYMSTEEALYTGVGQTFEFIMIDNLYLYLASNFPESNYRAVTVQHRIKSGDTYVNAENLGVDPGNLKITDQYGSNQVYSSDEDGEFFSPGFWMSPVSYGLIAEPKTSKYQFKQFTFIMHPYSDVHDYDVTFDYQEFVYTFSTAPITIYVDWEMANYYVEYDANGGTGTMPRESYEMGNYYTLTKNKFTRKGYTFKGWSTTKNGGVEYGDEADVYNLTTEGNTTVTLYAVWEINQYYFDVNVNINNVAFSTGGKEGFTFDLYRNNKIVVRNKRDYYQLQDYDSEMRVEINSYPNGYYFDRMRSPVWNTTIETETITVRVKDETTRVEIYFYSHIYEITLKYGNGYNDTKLYLKYDVGYFTDDACNYETGSVAVPTRTGYKFGGFYTGENGEGTEIIDENGTITAQTNAFLSDTNIYTYWIPKNEAIYDEEKGYWYVEMGYFSQTKVSDASLISSLDAKRAGGNEISKTYTIAGHTLKVYTLDNEEYAYLDLTGCYYKVEPVRYVLAGEHSAGEATESGNVTAVSEKIVFASVWNEEYLGAGGGYLDSDLRTNYKNFERESGIDDLGFAHNKNFVIKQFKDSAGNNGIVTESLSRPVSSESEIQSVFGDLSAEFSDLVTDILGGYLFYWTRDVGSNLNNAQTISAGGVTGTQMKMQEILGVRNTLNLSVYSCAM